VPKDAELPLQPNASGVEIALLASGRYRIVESLSTFMVFSFTACSLTAVIALQWTDKPVRAACIGFPLLNLAILHFWGPQPVSLVKVGALTLATLLPFLSLLALHVRFQRTDPRLRPGFVWTVLLCLAAATCGAVGVYQLMSSLGV